MKGVSVMEAKGSPHERAVSLVKAFRDAPVGTDVEYHVGRTDDGETAVVVSIGGDLHGLLASEALLVADVMERTLPQFPGVESNVSAMIENLRETVRQAEEWRVPN